MKPISEETPSPLNILKTNSLESGEFQLEDPYDNYLEME